LTRNASLFETCPVLASRCPATDLLDEAETRLAKPLPRDDRTNLPAFRQHVTLLLLLLLLLLLRCSSSHWPSARCVAAAKQYGKSTDICRNSGLNINKLK
jgi:hypothetical protein